MKFNCSYSELVEVSKLVPNPKNANTHPIEQIERLSKIIDFQGQRSPIVVSKRSGFITKGHGRLMAMKLLKWEQVAVDYQDYESEAQEYADIIADNEIARWASLDMEMLTRDLLDIELSDVELLGLEDFNLIEPEVLDPQTDEDEVPEVVNPISKLGDIWLLGNHRLMCGDSTMIDDVEKLMNGEKADMVFTDPPYNQNTQKGGGKGALADSLRKQSDDIGWICDFDPNEFLNCLPVVFNNTLNAYIFCNKDLLPEYLLKARELGASFWVLIWKKEGAIPINSAHHPDIEYLVVMRRKSIFNSGAKDVSYSRLIRCNRDRAGLHPTMKPVELIENQLLIGSNLNSLVVDFFGGSGSTMIACEKIKRNNYSMELSEKYCDVIINRWQNYTGKKATLESTKQTYEELKSERV